MRKFLWELFIFMMISIAIFLPQEHKTWYKFFLSFSISAVYFLGFGLSNGLLHQVLNQKMSWKTPIHTRFFWTILTTIGLNLTMTFLVSFVSIQLIQRQSVDMFSEKMMFANGLIFSLALFISVGFYYYYSMVEVKRNYEAKLEAEQLLAQAKISQFEGLKSQLDPHFLFNSLNILTALIAENPEKAQRFTEELSHIYRYILEQKERPWVNIAEEMAFAKSYLHLLKTRFEESIQFEILGEIPEEKWLIPLSLQLLLENAIKHNIATLQQPLKIRIYAENNHLIVENNLQKRPKNTARKGFGLTNIQKRYALQTQQTVGIEETATKFSVKLPIINLLNS